MLRVKSPVRDKRRWTLVLAKSIYHGTIIRMTPPPLLSKKIFPWGPTSTRMSVRVTGGLPCTVFFSCISWSKVFVVPFSLNRIRRIDSCPHFGRLSAST